MTADPVNDAADWSAHLSALRAQVRRDLRATSLPLLILGTATTIGMLPQFVNALVARSSLPLAPVPRGAARAVAITGFGPFVDPRIDDWFAGLLITAAFAVMWLVFRRRALRGGVGRSSGFGVAAVVGVILSLSVVVIALLLTGPFVVFGLGLLIAGLWQRNRFLVIWAVIVGVIGVSEAFYAITNRLPAGLWAGWVHPAIYVLLGAATVLAGVVARVREDRAR